MKKARIFLVQHVLIIILFVLLCHSAWAESLKTVENGIRSPEDVLTWAGKNLYYKNVEPWDKAPSLQSIIDNGYGDCKMLAGVVAELLKHVGVKNWIVTIEKKKSLHMFNVYFDQLGKLRIIDNLKLVPDAFDNWDGMLHYFEVNEYIGKHRSYWAFRKWFNNKIFLHQNI